MDAERASIAAFERAQRHDLAGCSRMALGFQLRQCGRVKESLAAFLSAEADLVASGEDSHRANALVAILDVRVEDGQFRTAFRLLRPALAGAAAAAPVPEVASLHELAARVLDDVAWGPAASSAMLMALTATSDDNVVGSTASSSMRTEVSMSRRGRRCSATRPGIHCASRRRTRPRRGGA